VRARRAARRGRPRESDAAAADPSSLTRLFVSLGKRDGVTADDIRNLLGKDLGDDVKRIGSVALRDSHCHVRVPEDLADRIISSVTGSEHNGTEVRVERARA
jgi:ATP-dependent RNA helicase DeaD